MLRIARLCLLTTLANAWWNTGHMLVARIAQDYLEEISPETLEKAIEILIDSDFANYLHLESNHPFVECATFADEIKSDGFADQSFWHYVNTPLMEDDTLVVHQWQEYNVTWAIEEMIKSLKQVSQNKSNSPKVEYDLAKSFNLRLLIHYVGDIH